ncbi:hypothetical protein CsSME_00035787 [Camellia sinensis var. sinensis]
MMITPYDFATITNLGMGGDPIPFDTDMGEWNIMGLYLLSALVTFSQVASMTGAELALLPGLALEPMEEFPLTVPYSKRYDGRWLPRRKRHLGRPGHPC